MHIPKKVVYKANGDGCSSTVFNRDHCEYGKDIKMKIIVLLLVGIALFSAGAESKPRELFDPDESTYFGDFTDEVPINITPLFKPLLKPFSLLPPLPLPDSDFMYVE